ncbi:hypothetical protein TorRG33x02_305250 [Trema orientale]|uniref:Uncharacterized protein n=1 Tax=Trema orientale TaxID=63057 RepID=A0A2P5BXL1_TREOI|nr:hypothetical protein TorRG33x02_305250 [Trema orientale]
MGGDDDEGGDDEEEGDDVACVVVAHGDPAEGDVACVVQDGELEVAVHGDQVVAVLRGVAAGGDDGDDLVVEDQASLDLYIFGEDF